MSRIFPLALLCIPLFGCASGQVNPSSIPQSPIPIASREVAAPSPTLTAIATVTPIPTITPTTTPVVPTPSFPSSTGNDIQLARFFFDTAGFPDCRFPCWKGLRIGQSKMDQVQHVMDNVFGFQGMLNFRTDSPLTGQDLMAVNMDPPYGHYAVGTFWASPSTGHIDFVAELDQDSDLLKELAFNWMTKDTSHFRVDMTPNDMLRNFGVPLRMMARANLSESAEVGGAEIVMIYENGLVYKQFASVPVVHDTLNGIARNRVKLCLGKSELEAKSGGIFGELYVMEPFQSNLDHLTTLQAMGIYQDITNSNMQSLEYALGITPQQAVILAQNHDDRCLYSRNL